MLQAWHTLFQSMFHRARTGRPPTPQLTSLENPEKYLPPSPRKRTPFVSAFSTDTPSEVSWTNGRHEDVVDMDDLAVERVAVGARGEGEGSGSGGVSGRPDFERLTSETGLLQHPTPFQSLFDPSSSAEASRPATPVQAQPRYTPQREAPTPPPRRLSTLSTTSSQPSTPLPNLPTHTHILPTTSRHSISTSSPPPPHPHRTTSRHSTLSVPRTNSSKMKPRPRVSAPMPGTFVHVNGAFMGFTGRGLLGTNPAGPADGGWENKEEGVRDREERR